MKQNKNSSVIRFIAFLIAVVVLLFSISVPSFAYTDSSTNGELFTVFQSSDYTQHSNGFLWASSDTGNYKSRFYFSGDSLGQDFICAAYGDPTYYTVLVAFPNASSGFGGGFYYSNTNTNYTYLSSTSSATSSQPYVYFYSAPIWWSGNVNPMPSITLADGIPVYSSRSDAISALRDYISNPTPPVSSAHSFSGSLPAGNAIILDVSGNNAESLSLSTSSALRHKDYWSDGNQMMGYFSTAPTSLSSPFDGTHSITWRGTGSPNLFGGYNTWNTTAPLLPTGNYLVIVNPAYPNDNPDSITSNQASNGAISITCGFVRSATVVPLSSSWDNGSIVSSSGNIRLDGEYDPDTDSWSFVNSSTGEPQNPVSGGLTDVDAEHITINDWLQNISHQIGSFFSGAIGAVSTLVSAGSDFIHSLSGLYAWLPAPVYSVLVSALILVITIGVIKVFI